MASPTELNSVRQYPTNPTTTSQPANHSRFKLDDARKYATVLLVLLFTEAVKAQSGHAPVTLNEQVQTLEIESLNAHSRVDHAFEALHDLQTQNFYLIAAGSLITVVFLCVIFKMKIAIKELKEQLGEPPASV